MRPQEGRLSISIDIGTTSSAVAICYVKAGRDVEPIVTYVSRWPGQEENIHVEQVPSALLYSSGGQVVACGAEVYARDMVEAIEDQGYQLVEHFKMHLHPNEVLEDGQHRIKPLPKGVTVAKVYADFLAYLLAQSRRHLKDVTGSDPWPEMKHKAELLLTHPNRWGTREQQFLEQATVNAGFMSSKDASTRLKFAEEGEASASFCLPTSPAVSGKILVGTRFIICDAGGSTADISAYKVKKTAEGTTFLKELDVPACLDAGGVRVDAILGQYIEERLKSVNKIPAEDIPWLAFDGLQDFQKSGKRKFSSSTDSCAIKIGGRKLDIEDLPVKRGIYTLKGAECEKFFGPSLALMVQAMSPYFTGRRNPTFLILTGGFGESPYVRSELTRVFGGTRVILSNPTNGKAVAIGGLRLLTDSKGLYRIDRKERTWPTRVADFFSRVRNLVRV